MPFGRKASLTLVFGTLHKEIDESYKIDFDITLATGGAFSSGSITITGLSAMDIVTMATCYSLEGGGQNILMPNKVILFAGYSPTILDAVPRFGQIFYGSAWQATTDLSNPDKSISLEVSSAYYENTLTPLDESYPVTSLSVLCTTIAARLGKAINFSPLCEKTLKNYKFRGTAEQHLDKLRQTFPDVSFYVGNTELVVKSENTSALGVPIIITPNDIIGNIEPTFLGCNVTTLLNPLAYPGALMAITSSRMPILTGSYVAVNVRHTGSTRDNQFYTTYECSRFKGEGSNFVGPMPQ